MGIALLLELAVVLVLGIQIRPDEPSNIPSLSAVEASQAPQRLCAKDETQKHAQTRQSDHDDPDGSLAGTVWKCFPMWN